jgi:hypothetical protein
LGRIILLKMVLYNYHIRLFTSQLFLHFYLQVMFQSGLMVRYTVWGLAFSREELCATTIPSIWPQCW